MLSGLPLAIWKSTWSNITTYQGFRSHVRCILSKRKWASTSISISSSAPASNSAPKSGKRKWSTPLAETLAKYIATTGPINLAAYMRQCLTSTEVGYYTRSATTTSTSTTAGSSSSSDAAKNAAKNAAQVDGADQFGTRGDFITSPEISQVFGELVGVWIVAEWMAQRGLGLGLNPKLKPRGIHLVELGPGRGTLMDDMLRAISTFKQTWSLLDTIYLVEASPTLRDKQRRLLCGDKPMIETDIGFQSHSKLSTNLKVIWVDDFRMIPKGTGSTPFIVAHEFFDALPIHAFQSISRNNQPEEAQWTANGKQLSHQSSSPSSTKGKERQSLWRELLVTSKDPSLSASKAKAKEANDQPEFQLMLSKQHTSYSKILPNTSSRYKAIENNPGSVIEISPEAFNIAGLIAQRIGGTFAPTSASTSVSSTSKTSSQSRPCTPQASSTLNSQQPVHQPSGAALIVDYGPTSTIPANSLRGIRSHRRVSPFTAPGTVDISADVDFTGLADAALDASPNVEVHGPVPQAVWLRNMGGRERTEALVNSTAKASGAGASAGAGAGVSAAVDADADTGKAATTNTNIDLELKRKKMIDAWTRLVDEGPAGMGRLYKVMAIVPYSGGGEQKARALAGFGDGLT